MRRLLMLALWSAATGVAVVVAWRGVAVVADTTDRQPTLAGPAVLAQSTTEQLPSTGATPSDPGTITPDSTEPATTPPASTDPATTTTPAAPGESRVVETVGGTAAVEFGGDQTVKLLWAQPAEGFTMAVQASGPDRVEVRFQSDDHESRLRAEWEAGAPDVSIEERPG